MDIAAFMNNWDIVAVYIKTLKGECKKEKLIDRLQVGFIRMLPLPS